MDENRINKEVKKLSLSRKVILEVGFIMFLFYSNLLMGEFNHSGMGLTKGLLWALQDIFTIDNFTIGLVLALLGQLLFDYLLKRR